MLLDTRSILLLEEIATNIRMSVQVVARKFDINHRQIDYSIKKINDFLLVNKLPVIKKVNNDFIADQTLLASYYELALEETSANYLFSEEERVILILIMLIGKREELSLQHFIIDLETSKNTILNDLKIAKKKIKEYEIKIFYNRNEGYYIAGSEFMIRNLLLQLIIEILDLSYAKKHLAKILGIEKEILDITQKINHFEKATTTHFTDNKVLSTPYFVTIILFRIENNHYIENSELFKEEILGTLEYELTEEIFNKKGIYPKYEMVYLTLHLLSIDISNSSSLLANSMPEIVTAITEIINKFEMNACISFSDRASLTNTLVQHIRPAYYRMKYGLTLSTTFSEALKEESLTQEFKEITSMVELSIRPLEKIVGRAIRKDELQLISLIFAGWLKTQSEELSNIPRAVVVCPQGISVSRILFLTLKELLPEVEMTQSISVREFKESDPNEFDLVFSTLFIQTDKPLFIVNSFITAENRHTIRSNVMQQIFGIEMFTPNIDEIISIVKQNAIITSNEKLKNDMASYFYKDDKLLSSKNMLGSDLKPSLSELIVPSHIILEDQIDSWEEAIRLAALPLLRHEIINVAYIDKLLAEYKDEFPFISFGDAVIVPHLKYEEAVSGVGMSFLRLKEAVSVPNNKRVNIIVVLATPDKNIHLKAMIELLNLSLATDDIQKIISSDDVLEIREVLKRYQTI